MWSLCSVYGGSVVRFSRPGLFMVVVAFASSCHAASIDASTPAHEESQPVATPAEVVRIRGTIASIRLQNINKAAGHYTYNVEIELRHEGVDRAGTLDPSDVANPITVRLDKVFWRSMSAAEREVIAPEGPQEELSPPRWSNIEVGQEIELDVTFSSPSLAHRVR
jgi:hypothetical protein